MDLMLRRRQLMAMQTGGLPGEYRRVEYLEGGGGSGGKPYINTSLIPTPNMRILIDGVTPNDVSSPGFIFGSRRDTSSLLSAEMFWAITWQNYYSYGLGKARNTRVTSAKGYEQFALDFNCNYAHAVKFNGVLSVNNDVANSYSQPIYLWGINTGGELDYQYVKGLIIKRFTAYESYKTNKMLMNLIPCVRKLDSKPGVYDTVSKTFYTNAGTGEFIVPA